MYRTAIACRNIINEEAILDAQLSCMAMDGCTILVVLGAIVAEDAVPYDSSIVENCSATIAVTIRSSLIDAVLHDESVKDCAN